MVRRRASKNKMRRTWCANCGCIIGDDDQVYLVTSQHTRKTEETDVFTGNAPPLGIIATTLNGLALAKNVCSGSEDGYKKKLAEKTRDQFPMTRRSLVGEDVLQELQFREDESGSKNIQAPTMSHQWAKDAANGEREGNWSKVDRECTSNWPTFV